MRRFVVRFLTCPNYLRRIQWPSVHKMLDCESCETVLDLGAGPMHYSIAIAQRSPALVIAVDLDYRTDHTAKAIKYGVAPIVASGLSLPFTDQSLDRVVMSSLLHMVPKPLLLLEECKRVLKTDGHLVVSVPNHYQFIPSILESFAGPSIRRFLKLPKTYERFISDLNERFQVGGPSGYYSRRALAELLKSAGFEIAEHRYSPGRFGSYLWELAVLGFVRFGNISFHLLFLTYPLAWAFEFFKKSSVGSEHIVKVGLVRD